MPIPTIEELKMAAYRARTGKWSIRNCSTSFIDDAGNC